MSYGRIDASWRDFVCCGTVQWPIAQEQLWKENLNTALRKMWFCNTKPYLGKGNPLRVPRFIPSGWWLELGIEPFPAIETVSPVNHSWETSLSHIHWKWSIDLRAFLPPRPQIIPLRQLHWGQPFAVWMPPACRSWTTIKGLLCPLKPLASDQAEPTHMEKRKIIATQPCVHCVP